MTLKRFRCEEIDVRRKSLILSIIQRRSLSIQLKYLRKATALFSSGYWAGQTAQSVCRLTAFETMRYSYGRSIRGGLRGDTFAGQHHVRIDLKGDGDQR